jgi:hypothetical protein
MACARHPANTLDAAARELAGHDTGLQPSNAAHLFKI